MAKLSFGTSKTATGSSGPGAETLTIVTPDLSVEEGSRERVKIISRVDGGSESVYDHVYELFEVKGSKGIYMDYGVVRGVQQGAPGEFTLDISTLPVGKYEVVFYATKVNEGRMMSGVYPPATTQPSRKIIIVSPKTKKTPFPKEYKDLDKKWPLVRPPDDVDHYYLFDSAGHFVHEYGMSTRRRKPLELGKKYTIVIVVAKNRTFKSASIEVSTIIYEPQTVPDPYNPLGRIVGYNTVINNVTSTSPPTKLKWIAIEHKIEDPGRLDPRCEFDIDLEVETQP
ncbi:hypothetical protein HY641_03210 [Candidatus Woesearchaeota archaeon]|nr:hypothetical protein [Candidatus Woesearchaeota archaeon]